MYRDQLYDHVKNYIYNNNLEILLSNRFLNEQNANYFMSASNLRIVYNIDEYFYTLIKENKSKHSDLTLNRYLIEISKELEQQPLLLLSLPIWKLDKNVLCKYISNYDKILIRINQINTDVNNIYKKFSNNLPISLEEFKKMIEFFTYTIPYASDKMKNAQDNVAKYILNNLYDSRYNPEMTIFLIKHFGYKKIFEERLTDTRIIIGSMDNNIYGESSDNYAAVNKKLLQNVILQDNVLEDNFGKRTIENHQYGYLTQTQGIEILKILHTLYHELRHQKQEQHSNLKKVDDLSYYYSAFEIINTNSSFDYKTNYKCYEIEKDANYNAWLDIEKLIKKYMPNKNTEKLMKNILSHKLKEELMQITGTRKTKESQIYISSAYLIKYLDNTFINNPKLLNEKYSQFLKFYNYNGTPKRIIELLKQSSIYDYKEFYFGEVNYRFNHNTLNDYDLYKCSNDDYINIVNNIKILMNINQQKLNKICDRVSKTNESNMDIIGNIKNYYHFAVSLSNIMNKIIQRNPSLLNILSVRNSVDSINSNIDLININRLVLKYINYEKITKINKGR